MAAAEAAPAPETVDRLLVPVRVPLADLARLITRKDGAAEGWFDFDDDSKPRPDLLDEFTHFLPDQVKAREGYPAGAG